MHYSLSDWKGPSLALLCSWVLPNCALILHFAIIYVKFKYCKDIEFLIPYFSLACLEME